jgi:UPF0755 protein
VIRKLLVVFLVLVLIAGGAAFWEYRQLIGFTQTPCDPPRSEIVVTIPAGMGPHGVSERLAKAGIIDDARFFYWDVRFLRGVQNKLKAGEYLFKAGVQQTPDEIIDRLLKGEVLSVKVTIPEGLRLDEQAPYFEEAGLGKAADYVRLAKDPKFVHSLGVDGLTLEGYLFPDTYLVPKSTPMAGILKMMVDRFHKAWAEADAQRSKNVKLSQKDAVTLASIVEKETGSPVERPRISCVFHNRRTSTPRTRTTLTP